LLQARTTPPIVLANIVHAPLTVAIRSLPAWIVRRPSLSLFLVNEKAKTKDTHRPRLSLARIEDMGKKNCFFPSRKDRPTHSCHAIRGHSMNIERACFAGGKRFPQNIAR